MDERSRQGARDARDGRLDDASFPRHVAIIMDGNGRWAAARALPRAEGHRRGVEALRRTVRAAMELGIETLTVYSFSKENWARPADEIGTLMALLRRFIRKDLAELHSNNVHIRVVGSRDGLPADIGPLLVEAEETTKFNDGLMLVIAFNYGGRQEIVAAARALASDVAAGRLSPDAIDERLFARRLMTAGISDPDLVIRTSGEQRVSNFLLWQGAYAEFVFLPVLWPDFDRAAMEDAIAQYAGRERRFGGRLPDQKTAS
jgi:undecaprenyl diphosphate synthase